MDSSGRLLLQTGDSLTASSGSILVQGGSGSAGSDVLIGAGTSYDAKNRGGSLLLRGGSGWSGGPIMIEGGDNSEVSIQSGRGDSVSDSSGLTLSDSGVHLRAAIREKPGGSFSSGGGRIIR